LGVQKNKLKSNPFVANPRVSSCNLS